MFGIYVRKALDKRMYVRYNTVRTDVQEQVFGGNDNV